MSLFIGSYKMESADNLAEFYTAAGMPWVTSKIMLLSRPTMNISVEKEESDENGGGNSDEDVWVIKTVSFLITREQSFKFGEVHDETMPNGDVCECVAEKVGENKIVLKNTGEDDSVFIRELEFTKDGITETMKMGDVQATRIFKRLQ